MHCLQLKTPLKRDERQQLRERFSNVSASQLLISRRHKAVMSPFSESRGISITAPDFFKYSSLLICLSQSMSLLTPVAVYKAQSC